LILCALAGWAPIVSTATCALAATLVSIRLQRGRRATAQALRYASGALKDELAMLAASVAELRCYGLEAWAVGHAAKHGEQLMQAQRRHATDAGRLDLMLAGITGLAAVLAIFLARGRGAPMAALAGLSAAMAIEGLAPLLRGALHLAIAERAAGRLDALLAEGDAAARSPMARVQSPASLELPLMPGRLLSPGARVAIVGPSGSGKTTLVETLLGLRRASPHVIRLGGANIGQLDVAAVRDHFAWLPQDATLIAGTVRDNLALAWPDAADVEIWQALHDAALADRIRACPNGLDTWLGEDGALLSGGERRRLALARAYLRRAPWLLLDEPTEGLDLATEAVVLERLAGRLHRTGQGLLAVSHRARVVLLCDEVLRIGSGPRPRYSTREYSARAESA
jgi:ATP-binding cassette subfamily C protein CydC